MNTDVKSTEAAAIVPSVKDKIVLNKDEFAEIIWQKKEVPVKPRFTTAELWNIRKNARKFKAY